jgi:capsular exopolysaccharide synthesis family protein
MIAPNHRLTTLSLRIVEASEQRPTIPVTASRFGAFADGAYDESMLSRRRSPRRDGRVRQRWALAATGVVFAAGSAIVTAVVRGSDRSVVFVVAGATVAGLLIGLGAAWVVERRSGLIRSRHDLASLSSAPNLAVVPRHPMGAERPDDVVMLREPNSVDAEAYRTLRTAFEFVTDRSDESTTGVVVLVSSPRPGEGKSSVAANLAAASAMAGRRVVLVDADLRKPQVHRLFRLPNAVGLSSLLSGEITMADAVQHLDAMRNLLVLPAGPPPPDPAELLTDRRLAANLDLLRSRADLVVVDAPPVLAVTDPTLIVQHCDGVLMVATAGLSAKREWVEALARLAVVDAAVIGTVLLEPDDRIRAVPTYHYAPSAVPKNWWVIPGSAPPASPGSDDSAPVGLRVVGGTGGHDRFGTARTDPDVSDGWPEHPAGR